MKIARVLFLLATLVGPGCADSRRWCKLTCIKATGLPDCAEVNLLLATPNNRCWPDDGHGGSGCWIECRP